MRPTTAPSLATGNCGDWRDTERKCRQAIQENERRLRDGDGDTAWLRLRIERDQAWIAEAARRTA